MWLVSPRRFLVRLPLDLAGQQQLAVERAKRLEGLPQQVPVQVPLLLRAVGPVGLDQRNFGPAPANQVDRGAQGDDPHPGRERRLMAVGRQGAERAEEGLLRGVFGERRVAGHASRGG